MPGARGGWEPVLGSTGRPPGVRLGRHGVPGALGGQQAVPAARREREAVPGARRGRVDILWRPGMAVARRGREAFIARRLRGHSTRCASRASWRPWRAGRAGRRPRLLGQRGVLSPARDGDGWPSSAPRESGRAPRRPDEREAVLGARREWPATLGAPGGRARGEAGWCCRRPVRVGTCLAVPRVWRGRAC